MKFQLSIVSFLCFALLAACSKPVSRNSQQLDCLDGELKTVGVFGGKTLSSDSVIARGTVFIRQEGEKNGKGIYIGCTGFLIDKNIVLTAAHCVPSNQDARKLLVAFSVDPLCEIDQGSSDLRSVEKVVIHPKYSEKDTSQFDLAMLRFEGTAPVGRSSLKLELEHHELTPQSEILVAGFGKTTDYKLQDPEPAQLRVAKIKPAQFEGAQGTFSTNDSVLFFDQRNGQGACQGDSGGPVFIKKENQVSVIGVISAGDSLGEEGFQNEQQITCKLGLRAVSVQAQKSWLKSTYLDLMNFNSSGNLF